MHRLKQGLLLKVLRVYLIDHKELKVLAAQLGLTLADVVHEALIALKEKNNV